jgi:GMP synthase (glutamine-hydrolysing)
MQKIGILDFGGQYTHLIARRIRELGIYGEIVNPEAFNLDSSYIGLIFSGGPRSVTETDLLSIPFDINKITIPLLGICYGHQLIARLFHGNVQSVPSKEYGETRIQIIEQSILLQDMEKEQIVWMSHGDSVMNLPEGFIIIASSDQEGITAFENPERNIFGIQFHPEVTHTINGMQILNNFLKVCTVVRDWRPEDFLNNIISEIQTASNGKKLLVLISGGIDSLVALIICIKAVGNENVFSIHVDTGFMRKNESISVAQFLHELGFQNIKVVDAREKFFSRLHDVTDPEEKRKIIGTIFVEVMHEELVRLNLNFNELMLVQGTIYPDTIESGGTKTSSTIKTHHNRVPEIDRLIKNGQIIEPMKELYKDEIRRIAELLDLPDELIQRRPFPGPGLAIRILARKKNEPVDYSFMDQFDQLYPIFAFYNIDGTILPVKSVGVQGDFRTYRHPILLWSNNKIFPGWKTLKECTNKLINQVSSLSRAIYSVDQLNNQFELGESLLTEENVRMLQEADAIIHLRTAHLKEIWQLPVISLPLFDREGKQVFVMRPVCSQDAMTADVFEMDYALLQSIIDEVKSETGAGYLFYDLTTKPPATIEWE